LATLYVAPPSQRRMAMGADGVNATRCNCHSTRQHHILIVIIVE